MKFTGEGLRRGIDSIEISQVAENSWQLTDLNTNSLFSSALGLAQVHSCERQFKGAEQLVSLVCSNQSDAVEWLHWSI